ncbi:MAG: DUF6279 family lipoprotein [Pseudomonadota bacterium]
MRDGVASGRIGAVIRGAVVSAIVMILAGCSAAGLVYNQADWLVTDYIAELAEFDNTQRNALQERLAAVHSWHRRSELPQYAELIGDTLDYVADGLTRAEVDDVYLRGRARYTALMRRFGVAAAPVLDTLRPDQVETLTTNLAEANDDFRDKYANADPEERRERRRERMYERVEFLVGDLSEEQRAAVKARTDAFPDSGPLWLAYREKQQLQLLSLLKERRGASAIEQHLVAWLGDQRGRGERLDANTKAVEDRVAEIILSVTASLDSSQRETLVDELRSYRRLIAELAADS